MTERPLPVRDDLNRAYWDGAQRGALVVLRCAHCGTYVHPPQPGCPACHRQPLEPTALSGRGSVYSWSTMHTRGNPGFEDKIPYTVLVVELDEQRHLITIGNLVDGEPSELALGARVEVVFEEINDEITLPQWRLTAKPAT